MTYLLREFLRFGLVGRDEKKRVTGVLIPAAAAATGHGAVLKVLEVVLELLSGFCGLEGHGGRWKGKGACGDGASLENS